MFSAIKFNSLRRQRTSVLGAAFFAVVMALLPISAAAQCSGQWDATGVWEIREVGGYVVRVDLTQTGDVLSGTASRWGNRTDGAPRGMLTANATGHVRGKSFGLRAEWRDGYRAGFQGRILDSGRVEGGVYLGSNYLEPETSWYSEQPLTCGWRSGKSRGNLTSRIPGNTPVKTSGIENTPIKTPFISAGQAIIPTPSHPFGIVPLSWDGGPDHPNVEVFVSIDNGAEIPAFSIEQSQQSPVWKQPRMSTALNLQRYHHYKFFLKGAGQALSTAAVVVP